MSHFLVCVNAVVPMFLILASGYVVRQIGMLREEDLPRMNNVAFRVFLPVLLFYNVYCSDLSSAVRPALMAYAVLGILGAYLLGLCFVMLVEKNPEKRGVMIQGIYRCNYVIMGVPIATALLGSGNLGPISILIAVVVPELNVLAVITLTVFRGGKLKPGKMILDIIKNPLIIGSCLGLLVLLSGLRLPQFLVTTVEYMGDVATPLQLFLLGAFFRFDGLRRYKRELIFVTLWRLVIIPAIFLGLAAAIGFRGVEFVSLIGAFASANAIASFTMTQQMGGDAELAGDIVVVTSALVCFTMFLWILLFQWLGIF